MQQLAHFPSHGEVEGRVPSRVSDELTGPRLQQHHGNLHVVVKTGIMKGRTQSAASFSIHIGLREEAKSINPLN